jgi:hypothetical protein
MRKRLMLVGVGALLAICLGAAAGASAATQFGDPCTANLDSKQAESVTAFAIAAPQSPLPTAVPAAGVITSWGMNVSSAIAPGVSDPVTLKVLRLNPAVKTAQVIGESSAQATTGANTFGVRIPVQAGDKIGVASTGGSFLVCEEPSPGAVLGAILGNPATGSIATYIEVPETKGRLGLFATVEPDADGDGYGDETQDQCPTDASTHGPCPVPQAAPASPAPTAPITLSASAAAKKSFLTVSLTTTAQASVTVTGTATIGKGKTVKLSGNTQTVALGALAKFTVLFPAKLKAALKQLPTTKKLTIDLSATAPGATTKTLTVKVPGQMKPEKKHHVR